RLFGCYGAGAAPARRSREGRTTSRKVGSTFMADDDDHQETADPADLDERADNIARVVKDYLREGEAFLVQCQEDEIVVEEAPYTSLQKENPQYDGRLLSIEDQLETGCGLTLFLCAVGGLFCLGLHAGWWDIWLDPNVTVHIKNWWFYVPLFAAIFFLSDWIYGRIARRRYRRNRAELFALMREEGYDRDTLVTVIKDMDEFEKVTSQLKLDRGPFPEG